MLKLARGKAKLSSNTHLISSAGIQLINGIILQAIKILAFIILSFCLNNNSLVFQEVFESCHESTCLLHMQK